MKNNLSARTRTNKPILVMGDYVLRESDSDTVEVKYHIHIGERIIDKIVKTQYVTPKIAYWHATHMGLIYTNSRKVFEDQG